MKILFASLVFLLGPAFACGADLRLLEAVKGRNQSMIVGLLSHKADVNAVAEDGATPLMWAAHWDDLTTADLLIRAGAKVNASNQLGVTPLSLACTNGSAALVTRLLDAGADPNLGQLSGETPLMTCSCSGNPDTVEALLTRGARVNQKGGHGQQTALMWAVAQQHAEVIRILLAHGADSAARSASGFTPLLFAAQQGDLDIAKLLLSSGASIREAAPDYGNALVVAAASGHEAFAIAVLDRGADPDSADSSGMTALHYALLRGVSRLVGLRVELIQHGYMFRPDMPKLVKALLDHHANPNVRISRLSPALPTGNGWSIDPAGATPFLLATAALDLDVMRMLVTGGADPLLATRENTTPLMLAAGIGLTKDRSEAEESAALEAAKMLVDLGADANAADSTGQTALHGAAYIGADAIIQFLVEHGARVDVKDSYGMTPVSIAEGIIPPDLRDVDKNPKIAHKSTIALLRKLQTAASPAQN
ncbi:MAG TPA: ankyrin repeat domain-containing protein [Bryobacteraceae bacterium]|jgi:ankyrin repeat protein|nr:ankyrin repeat domain-containing protein [Bryobacteraceae bacterium]